MESVRRRTQQRLEKIESSDSLIHVYVSSSVGSKAKREGCPGPVYLESPLLRVNSHLGSVIIGSAYKVHFDIPIRSCDSCSELSVASHQGGWSKLT